jgi:hypothetical protein
VLRLTIAEFRFAAFVVLLWALSVTMVNPAPKTTLGLFAKGSDVAETLAVVTLSQANLDRIYVYFDYGVGKRCKSEDCL